jgi:hypothetical protein
MVDKHSPEETAALASGLKQRRIRYVFVYTTYLRKDGEFSETYTDAAAFVTALKHASPEIGVLAWIGLPLKTGEGANAYHVDLSSVQTRRKIVEFTGNLIREAGFDGVHLDPEPIRSGDQSVLALLEEMRNRLGPGVILSIAARRIWPVYPDAPWPLVGAIAWREDYYRDIARRVDQLVVMAYDSGLPLAWMYRKWLQFEVISASRAVEGIDVELLIGISTSEEKTTSHYPRAENMRDGLQGVIDGLNDKASRPDEVDGVAVYPAWETDSAEWAIYESLWLASGSSQPSPR